MNGLRRVVIVYERAGQGHLAAAEVLRSVLQTEPDVEVVLTDGEELERDGGSGENPLIALWNWLIRRGWFRLADLILNHWFRVLIFPLLSVSAGFPRVKTRLKAMSPDAVVSTADAFSRALGDAANELGVPFTVLPIECSIFVDVMHPDAEYLVYFEETARAIQRFDLTTTHFCRVIRDNATAGEKLAYLFSWFTTYGVRSTEPLLFQGAGGVGPKANDLPCHVLGPLRDAADHAPAAEPAPNARAQILVASGSLGGRFVSRAVRRLLAMPNLNADVIALCGRDESLLAELQACRPVSKSASLECHGYVSDMPARLRRTSVLLARPSASLFLEAILAGVPLLIPAKATKNDSGTVDLTRAWRIGEAYDRDDEIPATLSRMLTNLGEYRARLKDVRARYAEPLESVASRIRSVVWRAPPHRAPPHAK
ncbi:MAG: hypothetical protein ABI672_13355 [Vicinamibacteria bacterium]